MAKIPNRMVIEIAKIDKVDELGNPVIGFEAKDYDECVIEELVKIKEKVDIECDSVDLALDVIIDRIIELKGEDK